jgi:hypothetical protein
LTQSDLIIKGVTGIGSSQADKQKLHPIESIPTVDRNVAVVMGGCHTLAFTDNMLVGDPIEKQSFDGMKFK